MFLHVSVCPQEGGTWAGIPPGQVHPPGQVPPLGRYTPGQVHTLPQCMLGYGQQAGIPLEYILFFTLILPLMLFFYLFLLH